MAPIISPGVGKLVPAELLVDIAQLTTACFALTPGAAIPAQSESFGTSGHRYCTFETSFNGAHVLAIALAICLYRKRTAIDGPLFLGIDTHAVSRAAFATVVKVHAANGVDIAAITSARVRIGIDPLGGAAVTAILDHAPGNGAPLVGIKVPAQNCWFAARPSGTENIYKLHAETFGREAQLEHLQAEGRALIEAVFARE